MTHEPKYRAAGVAAVTEALAEGPVLLTGACVPVFRPVGAAAPRLSPPPTAHERLAAAVAGAQAATVAAQAVRRGGPARGAKALLRQGVWTLLAAVAFGAVVSTARAELAAPPAAARVAAQERLHAALMELEAEAVMAFEPEVARTAAFRRVASAEVPPRILTSAPPVCRGHEGLRTVKAPDVQHLRKYLGEAGGEWQVTAITPGRREQCVRQFSNLVRHNVWRMSWTVQATLAGTQERRTYTVLANTGGDIKSTQEVLAMAYPPVKEAPVVAAEAAVAEVLVPAAETAVVSERAISLAEELAEAGGVTVDKTVVAAAEEMARLRCEARPRDCGVAKAQRPEPRRHAAVTHPAPAKGKVASRHAPRGAACVAVQVPPFMGWLAAWKTATGGCSPPVKTSLLLEERGGGA